MHGMEADTVNAAANRRANACSGGRANSPTFDIIDRIRQHLGPFGFTEFASTPTIGTP